MKCLFSLIICSILTTGCMHSPAGTGILDLDYSNPNLRKTAKMTMKELIPEVEVTDKFLKNRSNDGPEAYWYDLNLHKN